MEIDQLRQSVKQLESDKKAQQESYAKQIDALQQREADLQVKLHKSEHDRDLVVTKLSEVEKSSDNANEQVITLYSSTLGVNPFRWNPYGTFVINTAVGYI